MVDQLSIRYGVGGHEGEYVVHLPGFDGWRHSIPEWFARLIKVELREHNIKHLSYFTVLNRGSRIEIYRFNQLTHVFEQADKIVIPLVTELYEANKEKLDEWLELSW